MPAPTSSDRDDHRGHQYHDDSDDSDDPDGPERQQALERLRDTGIQPGGAGGVPMVLALLDHRGDEVRPVAATGATARDGGRTAAEVDRLQRLLLPADREPDARTTHALHAQASRTTFRPTGAAVRPAQEVPAAAPAQDGRGPVPGPALQRSALRHGSALRVVNYHLTPETGREALRTELADLTRDLSTIGLAELDSFFDTGRWSTPNPPVVPVFYEGFASAAGVAAQVCDDLGLTAWFAVCTGFVDAPERSQEVFARTHWIRLADSELDGRRLAMTWDEMASLADRHVVFPHTASHAGIADVVTDDDLRAEIDDPLRRVREVTGGDAAVHAWFLGTAFGASERHDAALVAAGHRYVVSNTMVQRIA